MRLSFLFILFSISLGFSQESTLNTKELDSLYREDQFYVTANYCVLTNKSTGLTQNKISLGFNGGFLRDFPLNKNRNIAIAPGIGYSFKNYHNSLLIAQDNGVISYGEVLESNSKNYFRLQHLEFPLEFRWRSSTPETHKFWRVYAGFKMSYLLTSRSYYSSVNQTYNIRNNPDFKKVTYSSYLSLGWNTWNINVNFGLTPLMESATTNLNQIGFIDMGLIFYIL